MLLGMMIGCDFVVIIGWVLFGVEVIFCVCVVSVIMLGCLVVLGCRVLVKSLLRCGLSCMVFGCIMVFIVL